MCNLIFVDERICRSSSKGCTFYCPPETTLLSSRRSFQHQIMGKFYIIGTNYSMAVALWVHFTVTGIYSMLKDIVLHFVWIQNPVKTKFNSYLYEPFSPFWLTHAFSVLSWNKLATTPEMTIPKCKCRKPKWRIKMQDHKNFWSAQFCRLFLSQFFAYFEQSTDIHRSGKKHVFGSRRPSLKAVWCVGNYRQKSSWDIISKTGTVVIPVSDSILPNRKFIPHGLGGNATQSIELLSLCVPGRVSIQKSFWKNLRPQPLPAALL